MQVHNSLKELLEDYNNKLLDRWTSGAKQDFTEFVSDYLSSNSLAFAKPEPLAKNKQTKELCYYCGKAPRVSDGMCVDCLTDDMEDGDF